MIDETGDLEKKQEKLLLFILLFSPSNVSFLMGYFLNARKHHLLAKIIFVCIHRISPIQIRLHNYRYILVGAPISRQVKCTLEL